MPYIRSTVPGSSSYGTTWPTAGSVAEVSATEAADLLRIDPARFTEALPEEKPAPVPEVPVRVPDDPEVTEPAAARPEVTEPAPAPAAAVTEPAPKRRTAARPGTGK
jgi:hypothetical protein